MASRIPFPVKAAAAAVVLLILLLIGCRARVSENPSGAGATPAPKGTSDAALADRLVKVPVQSLLVKTRTRWPGKGFP